MKILKTIWEFIKKYWLMFIGAIASILLMLLFSNKKSTKLQKKIRDNELDTERVKGKIDLTKTEIENKKRLNKNAKTKTQIATDNLVNQTKKRLTKTEAKAKVDKYTKK